MRVFAFPGMLQRNLNRLVAWISMLLLLTCTTQTAALGDTRTPAERVALDLLSTQTSVRVNKHVLPSGKNSSINVGGVRQEVHVGDRLTPAEYAALAQVLTSGTQRLLLDTEGRASGGTFVLNNLHSVGTSARSLSQLVIPEGVTVQRDFGRAGTLNLTGNFVNAGTFYAYSTRNAINNATITAQNISNDQGALLSTVVPTGGLPGVGSVVPNLDLTLAAVQNIMNAGRITSAGNLTARAGGSIINALPPGATGATPVMQAVNAVNLVSANTVNSGQIASQLNNINVSTQMVQDIAINNVGGQFQALNGAFNVRDRTFSDAADLSLIGGDLLAKELNLHSGQGAVTVDIGRVQGNLNIDSNDAHVRAASDTLALGTVKTEGDPTFINSAGGIIINGTVSSATERIAIIANGDITASGPARVITSGGTNGFDILMVAGAQVTGSTNSPIIPTPAGTPVAASVNFTTGNGGNIDLSASSATAGLFIIDSSGTLSAGNITLAARANGAVGGRVLFPVLNQAIAAQGASGSPSVIIFAGATSGTAVSIPGLISVGTGTFGTVNITTAQPQTSNGLDLSLDAAGNITSSNSIVAGTLTNSSISAGQINAGSVIMRAGGDIGSPFNRVRPSGTTVNPSGTVNLNIRSFGGDVYVSSLASTTTSLTGGGAGPGRTFDLQSISNITIANPISAPGGTINLTAGDSVGSISRSSGASLTASSINLAAGGQTGDIGIGLPILTDCANLTVNAPGGSVFIQGNRSDSPLPFNLGPSSAGNNLPFVVTAPIGSGSGINVTGNIAARAGTIETIQLTSDGNGDIASGGGTLTATNVLLSSNAGGTTGAGKGNITANTTAAVLTVNTSGGNVSVQNSGSVLLFDSSAGDGRIFRLNITPGTGGSISALNIAAPSLGLISRIELIADGAGRIQSFAGRTLTADTVVLRSDSGNGPGTGTGDIRAFGGSDIHLLTNAGTLSANTKGNVFVQNAGSLNIISSSAGDGRTFDVQTAAGSGGGINVAGDIRATEGTIGTIRLASDGAGDITTVRDIHLTATSINLSSDASGVNGAGTGNFAGLALINAVNLTLRTTGDVSLQTVGSVILGPSSAGNGHVFDLSTQAGSGGSITVAGDVAAASGTIGTLRLAADGAGGISRTAGTLSATNVELSSDSFGVLGAGTGNIGGSVAGTQIFTAADSLSVNTRGNVFIREANNVILSATGSTAGAGQTFSLSTAPLSNGSIAISGPVRGGTVNLTADGSGSITSTIFGSCAVCGNTINLKSGTGSIGSGTSDGSRLEIASNDEGIISVLTANTKGSVFLLAREEVNLFGSSASNGTFDLLTLAGRGLPITINGDVRAPIIALESDAGILRTSGTLFGTDVTLTSVGGPGQIGERFGSRVVVGAIGNFVGLTVNTDGSAFLENSSFVDLQASTAGNNERFSLTASPGSGASVEIDGNIQAGTGTLLRIELRADGSGSISRLAGTLTANEVALSSNAGGVIGAGTGNIGGSSGQPILTATPGLAANTSGTGIVNVSNTGPLSLSQVTSGGTLNLTNSDSLTIGGPINTFGGGATLQATLGTVTVQPNTVILVKQGDLLIQTLDSGAGSINIGAGANIQTVAVGKTVGRISIVVGPVPAVPVAGKAPANVTVVKQKPGKVFYGKNGITTAAAPAPRITLKALKLSLVFNTSTRPGSAISLGGGALIVADPFDSQATAHTTIIHQPLLRLGDQLPALKTGNLPVASSVFTLTPPNAGSIIPADMTFPASSPGQAADPGILELGSAGAEPLPDHEPAADTSGDEDSLGDKAFEPVAYRASAAYPIARGLEIKTTHLANSVIKHTGRTCFDTIRSDCVSLMRGEALVRAENDTLIRCGNDLIAVAHGAIVLVSREGNVVKVRNLHEPRVKSARVQFNGSWVGLSAGEEMILAADDASLSRALCRDKIGRRKSKSFIAEGGKVLVHSEVSPVSLMQGSVLLSNLTHSRVDRVLTNKLIKMAACLMTATTGRGPYATISDPSTLPRVRLGART